MSCFLFSKVYTHSKAYIIMTKSLINEIKAIRQQMEETTTELESVLEEVTGLKDELYEKL